MISAGRAAQSGGRTGLLLGQVPPLWPQTHKPDRGHPPASALLWALPATAPLSSVAPKGAMPASSPGSNVASECISWGQLGTPLQMDRHRAISKGCFPAHLGTARAPAEQGQPQGAEGDLAGKPWSPFPAAAGMHVVQSPLVTDCIAACARIQLDSSPRGDVPCVWWQEEGEGRPPWCCRRLARQTCHTGPQTAMAQAEACPPTAAGIWDPAQHRPGKAELREAEAARIWGKTPLGHAGICPQSRAMLGAPKAGGSSRELLVPTPQDPAALRQPLL